MGEIVVGAAVGAVITIAAVAGIVVVFWRREERLLDRTLAEIAGLA